MSDLFSDDGITLFEYELTKKIGSLIYLSIGSMSVFDVLGQSGGPHVIDKQIAVLLLQVCTWSPYTKSSYLMRRVDNFPTYELAESAYADEREVAVLKVLLNGVPSIIKVHQDNVSFNTPLQESAD